MDTTTIEGGGEVITATFIPKGSPPADNSTSKDPVTPEVTPEVTPAVDTKPPAPTDPLAPKEDTPPTPEAKPDEAKQGEDGEADDSSEDGDPSAEDQVVLDAGLTRDAIAAEYEATGGKMSEETLSKLADVLVKAGYKPEDAAENIRQHFAGIAAQRELNAIKLYSVVGGEEGYAKIAQWAQANMTPAELQAHDRALANAVAANSLEGMQDALRSLKSRYDAAFGTPRVVVEGDGSPTPTSEHPIMSVSELARIKATPEYKEDRNGFRASVTRRLQAGIATGKYRN